MRIDHGVDNVQCVKDDSYTYGDFHVSHTGVFGLDEVFSWSGRVDGVEKFCVAVSSVDEFVAIADHTGGIMVDEMPAGTQSGIDDGDFPCFVVVYLPTPGYNGQEHGRRRFVLSYQNGIRLLYCCRCHYRILLGKRMKPENDKNQR